MKEKTKSRANPLLIFIPVLALVFILILLNHSGDLKVGDFVEFGGYSWEVLEIKGSDALVISERILEHRCYHSDYTTVTWAESDIRKYLNGDFLNENFSEDEIKRIKTVKIKNADNPWDFSEQGGNYKTLGGADTKDKVFLLSLDEVVKYMGSDKYDMLHQESMGRSEKKLYDGMSDIRKAYDMHGHIGTLGNDRSGKSWLLRSPGCYTNNAAFVANNGDIRVDGYYVDDERSGIRPAMWIKKADTLKKSVVECNDPDCNVCACGMYTDNPSPDSAYCFICDTGGDCIQKTEHFRLYHQWRDNWHEVQDPIKLEAVEQLRDEYQDIKSKFKELIKDAFSMETGDGRVRTKRILGHAMYDKMTAYLNDGLYAYSYTTYDNSMLDAEEQMISHKIELANEAMPVIENAIISANNRAISYEELEKQDAGEFLGGFAGAAAAEGIRQNITADDETLAAIFDDNILQEWAHAWADEKMKEYTDAPGTIDTYLQTTFFN